MELRLVISAAVLALALGASTALAQDITLTPQIALGTLEQAEADAAFEARTLGQLAGLKSDLGEQPYLLKKDRGPHPGHYAVFVTMPPGSGRMGIQYMRAFPTVTQYQLVDAEQLGTLPTVDVLAVHYMKVQPGKADAFETFITEKLNPAVGNLRPDLRFLHYRGAGPAAGSYITVVAITKASRDKYWPGGSDSEDLTTAFTPEIRALATDELQPFLVENSFGVNMAAQIYEAREWADWFVVTAPAR
jgi:hypothetical protein